MTSGVACLTPPLILVDGDTVVLETLTKPKMMERVSEFSRLERSQSLRLFTEEGSPLRSFTLRPAFACQATYTSLTSSLTHDCSCTGSSNATAHSICRRQLPAGSRLLLKNAFRRSRFERGLCPFRV